MNAVDAAGRRPRRASRRTRRCRAAGAPRRDSEAGAAPPGRSSSGNGGRRHDEQRVRHSVPWTSTSRRLPARAWSPSTFWVASRNRSPSRSSRRDQRVVGGVGLGRGGGRAGASSRSARRARDRRRSPSGEATCSTGWPSQSPPAPRNVARPLSAEMPAPVRTRTRVRSSIGMRACRRGRGPPRPPTSDARVDHHVLDERVVLERVLRAVLAPAGLLHAAVRRLRRRG